MIGKTHKQTNRTSSALSSALFVFMTLALIACSPKYKDLFFDIPPEKATPKNEDQPIVDSSVATSLPTGTNQQSVFAPNPADLEIDRPPIEDTLDWEVAMEMLPKDFMGQPDWSTALENGVIKPRALAPADRDAEVFKLDFYFKGANPMFDAYFPHSKHVQWMGCNSCHPKVFKYRDNEISMSSINNGEYCGACHGKVAFAATACKRCHLSIP